MRGSSVVAWLREKNPWKTRQPSMPYFPEERPRPLTASSECQGSEASQLFIKIPREIRLEILRLAFGSNDVHIELDYGYPPTLEDPPTKAHAARKSIWYSESWCRRSRTLCKKYRLVPNKRGSKKWRWWSCVCHRFYGSPFESNWYCSMDDLSQDNCKFGLNECCEYTPGEVPFKCHVRAMGWLLCCRQAYREGIHVLYSTNAFLFSNTELILNLPKLLLPCRLESMTRVEMLWRVHPFREQQELDPPLSDLGTLLTLAKKVPSIFPNLTALYVSLVGDMYAGEGPTVAENYATEADGGHDPEFSPSQDLHRCNSVFVLRRRKTARAGQREQGARTALPQVRAHLA